jgi:hypothetical protein
MLAPGSMAEAKKKKTPPPPVPDVCSGIRGGGPVAYTPFQHLQFNVDLGDYLTDLSHVSCTGWDYTLTVYGNQNTSLTPIATQTIAGDGTQSTLSFSVDLDYSKFPAGQVPGGIPPGTSVYVVGTDRPHGASSDVERAPDSSAFPVCSATGQDCPSSSFH